MDAFTNALRQNRLPKANIDDKVCNNLRRACVRKNGRESDVNRPVDRLIVSQAHYVVSGATDLVTAHGTMLELFASGNPKPKPKAQTNRFRQLLLKNRYIQKDSLLYDALREVRRDVMKNPGNPDGYVHREGRMKDNRCLLERIYDESKEKTCHMYWIRATKTKTTTEETLSLPQSVLDEYPYEVIQPNHYVFTGLKSALEKKKIVNPNTKYKKQFRLPIPMYPYKKMKCFVNPINPTEFKLCKGTGRVPTTFESTPGATFLLCTIASSSYSR